MNQITISIFNGVAANQTQFVDAEESLDFEELKKVVSRTSWSPFLFRDVTDFLTKKGKRVTGKYRESSCFLSTGLLVYDVDDGFTLKEGVEKCQNLSLRYLVATTRSHQKEKNGKPACDRYRVVLFLSRVITDANEYGAVWRHFAGAFGVDPSCKDLARFYFSCREIVAEGSGNPVDVDQILKNGGEPPPPEFDATNVNGGSGSGGRYGQLSRSTLDFIANGRKADESWHKRFFKAATDLREQGYPIEEARRRLIFAAKDELGCLDKEDEHLLQDVYARVNRYPPRGSEAARSSQDDGPAAFPKMDSAAFIGLPGEVVAAVEPHTEADPIAILIQLLNMIGNVVGRNRYYQVEGDRHFANLFTVLIGETARARKGTSYGRCIPILKTTDGEWFLDCVKSGLSSGEGLIHNVRDPGLRHTTKGGKQKVEHDPGVSDKRLFIQEGEFASVLKVSAREGNTLSAVMRLAWDHGNLATLTKNSSERATDAHISINGHITEEELLRLLTTTDLANGFANRILWTRIRRSKHLPFGGDSASVNIEPLVKKAWAAVQFGAIAGPVVFDEAAREIWVPEYERLTQPRKGMYGAITARSEALVIRLALIYAICDCSEVITPVHLRAALAVWDYADWSCRSLFGESTGDKLADAILAALQTKPEGLTRTQISHDLFKRNKSAEEIERALSALESRKLAFKLMIATEGKATELWKAGSGEPGPQGSKGGAQ